MTSGLGGTVTSQLARTIAGLPAAAAGEIAATSQRDDLHDLLVEHEDPRVRQKLARNLHVRQGLVGQLTRDREVEVVEAAVARPGAPVEAIRLAAQPRAERFSDHGLAAAAAANPSCPSELFAELAERGPDRIRVALVSNPACPVELLVRLAHDPSSSLGAALAAREDLPPGIRRQLAEQMGGFVRQAVAGGPASGEVLEQLADDDLALVRARVAANPATPVEVLRKLAGDELRVREGLAVNPASPGDLLEGFAATLDGADFATLLWQVFANPALPPAWVERAISGGANHRSAVVAHPHLSDDQLCRFLDDPQVLVRAAAARHPNLSADSQVRFAAGAGTRVLRALALRAQLDPRAASVEHNPGRTADALVELPDSVQAYAAGLWPSWTSSLDELVEASRRLTTLAACCVLEAASCPRVEVPTG